MNMGLMDVTRGGVESLRMPGRISLVIGIPSGDDCKVNFALCLAGLLAHCAGQPLPDGYAINARLMNLKGSLLPRNRELITRATIQSEADYLLFLDDDMEFPVDTFHRLYMRKRPVVAANCPVKEIPSKPTARRKSDKYPHGEMVFTDPGMTHCERVWRVGTGIMLIRKDVLAKTVEPRFPITWNAPAGEYVGEDWGFCQQLEDLNIPIYVDHQLSHEIKHIGAFRYTHELVGEVVNEQKEVENGRNTAPAETA